MAQIMTNEERQKIISYYEKGYSIDEIYIIMPFTLAEIKSVVKAENTERRKPTRSIKPLLQQAVKDGCRDVNEIAEKFGVSKTTVHIYCRTGHQKPHYNKSKTNDILDDLRKGDLSLSEIAIKHNVSRQAVFNCKKFL